MNLFLMRHGAALPPGGPFASDAERPLSAGGQEQVSKAAEGLKRRGVTLDGVLTSPLLRARQTGEIVARAFGISKVDRVPFLAPNPDFQRILQMLASESRDHLLLVGHHPDLTALTALLTHDAQSLTFQTASVVALTWNKKAGTAEFLWFRTSEDLSQA
jgi:phosphohistidine phosphatase